MANILVLHAAFLLLPATLHSIGSGVGSKVLHFPSSASSFVSNRSKATIIVLNLVCSSVVVNDIQAVMDESIMAVISQYSSVGLGKRHVCCANPFIFLHFGCD